MRERFRGHLPPRPTNKAEFGALLKGYFKRCASIDTRSLALFRIALGLIIITEMLLRFRNFSLFYTHDGLVPGWYVQQVTGDNAFSIYFYVSDPRAIAALFVVQILVAMSLVVGYRTTAATVISLLFMVSIDHFNPVVTSYADTLLRLLLFWAIFLPIGERWSIDSLHRDRETRPYFVGFASILAMGQMVYMYTRNGHHKVTGNQWLNGEATPLILGREDITFLIGEYTHHITLLLELGTYLWTGMMVFAVLLILLPGRWRYLLIPLYMGGHGLFAVTVRIGMFPYVALAGLLLFIPTVFWKDIVRILDRFDLHPAQVYERMKRLRQIGSYAPKFELTDPQFRSDFYNLLVGIIVITLVIVATVSGLQLMGLVSEDLDHDREVERAAATFNLDQPDFSIFAPNPGTNDRYYVFPARTESGEVIDVYNERNFTWDLPYDGRLHKQYDTYRERFFMNSIRRSGTDGILSEIYAEYLCENYVTDDGEKLTHVDMWVRTGEVTFDTIGAPEDREWNTIVVFRHGCGDRDADIVKRPP